MERRLWKSLMTQENSNSHNELLDVLEGYAAATPHGNDKKILDEWMATHPEYASDLVDFAVSRTVLSFSSSTGFGSDDEKRAYLERTRKTHDKVLASRSPVLHSILKRASELELKKKDLIDSLGISPLLLDSLESRAIEFGSIPKTFISKISAALKVQVDAVSAYLQQPMISAGFHKNSTRPEKMRTASFTEAVQGDVILSEEQKQKLLSM